MGWQKTCWGYLWSLKFCTQVDYCVLKKTSQNDFFHRGTHHCENGLWKIQIFCDFFHRLKYLTYDFEASVQLVPTFYSHPVCRLLELQLILASEEDCVQLVPKYYSKVKLRSWQSPNILSEIMRLLQNGGSGINLTQISNLIPFNGDRRTVHWTISPTR